MQGSGTVHKHDRVLELYTRLLNGELIRKQELAEEYGVSDRSIQRDIDSVRGYLSDRAVKGNGMSEVIYDHAAKGFRLNSSKTVSLTNAELFAAAKILLESRSLRKDEMEHIILELIEAGIPISEQKKMSDLLRNELFHYVEPRHGKELVDTIWKLGNSITEHHFVRIRYKKPNGEITEARVKPVGIMNSEYYFYLIAYIENRDKKYPGYPTIYRIDRIESYRILDDTFHIPYRDRFEEGQFRKRIPFMYGGRLYHAKFVYHGTDINAVLDRLPTAQAEPMEDGSWLVSAEVYGKEGLNLWLKGQNVSAGPDAKMPGKMPG